MVICDAHVHLYPRYDLARALDALIQNLRRWAVAPETSPTLLACLTERSGFELFAQGDYPRQAGEFALQPAAETGVVAVLRQGEPAAFLIPGRQFVALERVEVLALGLATLENLDGLPVRKVMQRVREMDGLPVLPWAPGKWLNVRGAVVRDLIREYTPGAFWLGDTSLRPRGWSLPELLQMGCRYGIPILPGSDPLPFAGEEIRVGCYGFLCSQPFDAEHPCAALKQLLRSAEAEIQPVGARNNILQTGYRLVRNYFQAFPPQ